jgi:O-acetyl-ADP-ribose deacetylase (regulator of RNase III)
MEALNSMITLMEPTDDIFKSDADILVNPVNIMGVSGAGLALAFKLKFPMSQVKYEETCALYTFDIGSVLLTEEFGERPIAYFPTKRDWQNPSELWYIEEGLDALLYLMRTKDYNSAAIPALGCGYGGLKWDEVRETLIDFLTSSENMSFEIYPPR